MHPAAHRHPEILDTPSAGYSTDAEFVRAVLEQSLLHDELEIPSLPEIAISVVRTGAKATTDAQQLSEVIHADRALAAHVLRIAASAANRPKAAILTLTHAVAWLGFDEVANIAFTRALQGRLLDVPGQQPLARRLWRHSLASALWSRQLALALGEEAGLCYLCGLLHDIGRLVALGAVHGHARRWRKQLTGEEYERLIDGFHAAIGDRVRGSWALPPALLRLMASCDSPDAGLHGVLAADLITVAHRLAEFTQSANRCPDRDRLRAEAAYRRLGLCSEAERRLFDDCADVHAELDRYLAP